MEDPETKNKTDDWTFFGAATRELTHCYHDYPARMIPQVAGKLMEIFGNNADLMFDPYTGSGTSLVEANIRGINAIGTDLNPLARLIAKAKTATPALSELEKYMSVFNKMVIDNPSIRLSDKLEIEGISRLHFWFKPEVIQPLIIIRDFIQTIEDESVCLFFQVAFSETVRESSNTRNKEFKLFRYSLDQLGKFNPHVFQIMTRKLQRNLLGYRQFRSILDNRNNPANTEVFSFNTVEGIPPKTVPAQSIDLIVTSPPYGDSSTTVAYGQYSRLSAAWLGLSEPGKIDQKLMGGHLIKNIPIFPSDMLNNAIQDIYLKDEKRAREIASFYFDLLSSIANITGVIKPNGYVCYVVGNRKVKGIILPTSIAVKNFYENVGFTHITTFLRSIPNKRMPSRNSPTNVSGIIDNTMTQEFIVVMQRR